MNNMYKLKIIFILLSSTYSNGMDVKIDGKLDLGPKWSYEFQSLRTERDNLMQHERKRHAGTIPDVVSRIIKKYAPKEADIVKNYMFMDSIPKEPQRNIEPYKSKQVTDHETVQEINESTVHKKVTKPYETERDDTIYVKSRKVKHDAQIAEFTKHIYKQSLKVFDAIKQKVTDEKMKKEVDFLARSYEEKFGDFVRETQNQKMITRLGRQKVILNTLDTSNMILKRLVNYLVGKDKNLLRSEAAATVFQNEVKKKIDIEKSHICKKFGICRSDDGFARFLVDLITIALSASDKKIKELSDAVTEVMKYADFSHIMNYSTEKHFQKGISDMESYDVDLLKPILFIVKNVMLNRNKPIEVIGEVDKRVNKTVGVIEIMNALETALPPNEQNLLEWEDIKNSLWEWKEGKRNDILEIAQSFFDHVAKGVKNLDENTAQNLERNLNLLLGFL